MEKNALLNHEVVMASSDKTTNNFISKMKKEGRLIKIAAKIYTTNLNDTQENIIRRNLFHPWRAVPRCRHESSQCFRMSSHK